MGRIGGMGWLTGAESIPRASKRARLRPLHFSGWRWALALALWLGLGASGPVALSGVAADAADDAALPEGPLAPRPALERPPLFFYLGEGLSDPVELALDQAEAALRRGEKHYQAGHLEKARREFDRAVDLLLSSPFDLRQDPRLLFGFDHIVDRIHELERAALANEPPDVPAAIEEIVPLTFPIDPELRAAVERELATLTHDLPITVNDRVLRVVNFFQTAKGRRIIENGLRRAGRYREMITRTLAGEGLPRDLIYMVQAESAFQPHARSRARAVGMWQFMSFRAREYGLKVNWWVDERRDPVRSTQAAARHLRDLFDEFKDWYLVMAAYNGGPGRVRRALARAGGQADFWTLARRRLLPRETRNHVPIILAVALVAKNPERYGFTIRPDPPLRYEKVKVDKPIDLRRIAEILGVNVRELRALNPHLIRNVTPPNEKNFELYVPPGTAETLAEALPRIPEAKRVYWQRYRVRRGDTLSHIAARYGSSANAIAQANSLSLRSIIRPGQVLVIPSGGRASTRARARRGRDGRLLYRVRRGDSLSGIAARHGTSAAVLARANGLLLGSIIHPGDRLVIPEPSRRRTRARSSRGPRASSGGGLVHRVRRGETLWELARQYGVTVSDLRRANTFLTGRQLRAGDRLRIPQ
ncbi:MAG: LysM peptidoglycan-binding domain-containing protein [Terriglobia bacterium]